MKPVLAGAAALCFCGLGAKAQIIPPSCLIVAGVTGVLAASDDAKTLTTVGSIPGTAVITTIGSFRVQALAPSSFLVAPSGSDTNTSFSATYSLSGATSRGETPGAFAAPLNSGITTMSIDLTAAKNSGVFHAGLHSAAVTVRCEP